MTDFTRIRYREDYDVARIVLARRPLNILTIGMMLELGQALARVAKHPTLKVLALTGEGKAFSAGVAIEDHTPDRVEAMLDAFHGIFRQLWRLDCVTVAGVRGAALGGGAELATFCDVAVAAADATFGQPEIKVGVFPPIAALHYPRRIGLPRTLGLLLSGEVIDAEEAGRIGLVDRVVAPEALDEAVEAEIERFRAQSAVVLRLTKRAVRESLGREFEAALGGLEDLYRYDLMTSEDAKEGLQAFLDKRRPVWKDR